MGNHASRESTPRSAAGSLLAGGLAAILASTCCVGPLVLLTLGFSGAWIANLTAFEPYRPVFIGVALVALWLAARRLWRPAADCRQGQACAAPGVLRGYKLVFIAIAALLAIALVFPYVAHWFY